MPSALTAYFGELEYLESAVFQFPWGLPGFEKERKFLFVNQPHTAPLLFLQSLRESHLCFVLLPILTIDPDYQLVLDAEDLNALRLPSGRQPRIGSDVLCGAILRVGNPGESPTANLLAPIVVNLKEQIGAQVIQADTRYSHRHPIAPDQEMALCS